VYKSIKNDEVWNCDFKGVQVSVRIYFGTSEPISDSGKWCILTTITSVHMAKQLHEQSGKIRVYDMTSKITRRHKCIFHHGWTKT
jgi:hypothetical protein